MLNTVSAPPVASTSFDTPNRLAYSINELSAATSIGRTSIYAEAKAGRLKLTTVAGRTVVLIEDAKAWLRGETGAAVSK